MHNRYFIGKAITDIKSPILDLIVGTINTQIIKISTNETLIKLKLDDDGNYECLKEYKEVTCKEACEFSASIKPIQQ